MKRNFCIGSEWLYYKIYTGVKTSDIILLEKLNPVIEDLKAQNLIEKWFFIRYRENGEHIRIRFYSKTPQNLFTVMAKLYPVLNELLEQHIIWKIQTDTYQREMERYGSKTIEASESLFYFDSEMILEYLSLKPHFIEDDTQLLFSFLSIDSFLNSFSLATEEKLKLLNTLQLSFKKEFNADKVFKKELDKHYRALSDEINSFLNYKMEDDFSELYEIIRIKEKLISRLVPEIKSKLEIPLHSFLSSHIHMMINRQFTSKQTQYECIIYDHLYRHYKKMSYAF